MALFAGNEFEKKIGDYGSIIVDVTPDAKIKIAVVLELDVIAELDKVAAKTSTQIDNNILSLLKTVLAVQAGK